GSDTRSVATPSSLAPPPIERTGGIGDSRPPSFHATAACHDDLQGSEVKYPVPPAEKQQRRDVVDRAVCDVTPGSANQQGRAAPRQDSSGDSGAATESQKHHGWRSEVYLFCVIKSDGDHTNATCFSERYNFLGISIVGQSNDRGDGGIYIGSIMKGGAVAADGRIEPGDMLLQVPLTQLPGEPMMLLIVLDHLDLVLV
ncbi:hypothetical protein XENOCAPTIV_001336, partial [Xenoophorus captivus]